MNTCDTMSQLLRTYDAVLDAHYHQVTLYSLVLEFNDDGDAATADQVRSAVEKSRRMMHSTRSRLDMHVLQHGCAPHMEPAPETFRRDLSF
jgi:hypothetical protein